MSEKTSIVLRTPGSEKLAEILEQNGIVPSSLTEVCSVSGEYMGRKPKYAPPELITQAIKNNPLEQIPRWEFSDEEKFSSLFRQGISEMKQSFLSANFPMLDDLGVSFESSIADVSKTLERIARERDYLKEHIGDIFTSFNAFREIFSFVQFMTERGRFHAKHLTSIYTICSAFTAIKDVRLQAKLMKPIGRQIEFNRERYIFELPTVLSADNLAEILLAFPVCFLSGKGAKTQTENDPQISQAAKLLCDLVGSKEFTWFYLMYNRRDRTIKDFVGPDPIPSDYLDFRKELGDMIDLEVIATPYHSIASKEWNDPSWLAGIDPVALGIHTGIPFVTVFKRWSGNGVFPLLLDLMADTISHIEIHGHNLQNFKDNTYWYKGKKTGEVDILGGPLKLVQFAQQIVAKFKEGTALQFLRG
ncbi:MAG: hypothetical protein M5R37_02175 [Melioribacteraceae bacterium]|nr:hypothetical protein [Melioribacteraceae bacterium]